MEEKHGFFVVSLDLELFWGMFDKTSLEDYGPRVLGERTAIPRLLSLFSKYGIHATWASVGMLMSRNKEELLSLLPPQHLRPMYEDVHASAYYHIDTGSVGDNEESDPYHFGPSFISQILNTEGQEIGNHTFSHYYCIDGMQNDPAVFARDLETFRTIAGSWGVLPTSIIFPRNQPSHEALYTCAEYGIRAYRGTETHILYVARKESEQSLLIRGLRLLDHYFNISGHHTYPLPHKDVYGLYNIPASRFFRPWMRPLRFFEWLRVRRIKNSMTHAAKRGEIFHLWWHPHNMGIDQKENFRNLETILAHFAYLRSTYDMESASMEDVATRADARSV